MNKTDGLFKTYSSAAIFFLISSSSGGMTHLDSFVLIL